MTNPEKTILIDMDGVVANFDDSVHKTLQTHYPHVPIPNQRNNFYIEDDMAPEYKPVIREIISRPGFFAGLDLIEGALEGWERLHEAGYRTQICTAPLRKNPTCKQDKLHWLEEHFVPRFGYWVIDSAIIDKDKASHPGLAIIEDRPEVEDAHRASWTHIVFDQTYNQNSPTPHRLRGWNDPLMITILNNIENKKR